MSVFRLIAITLPMAVLIACGGGGGGGTPTTAAPSPTITPENLPDAPIEDTQRARTLVGGSEVTPSMDSAEIEQALGSIASASGSELIFSDIIETSSATPTSRTVTCTANNRSCSGDLSDGTTIEFSLESFGDVPEVNTQELMGFNKEYSLVMTDRDVTLGQVRAAGRLDGVRFEYQGYGGWLTNSVFGVQSEIVDGSGSNDISYLTAYSFGSPSGSNPTVAPGVASWDGVMVGANTRTGDVVQGDVEIQIASDNPNNLAILNFNNITNLDTGDNIGTISFSNTPIMDGRFESASGDIEGTFYGTGHEEVGGVFNRNNILGSFGATRQP